MATPIDLQSKFSTVKPLLWAVYLGVSWTWVIGMFLPVLLVRDYGLWGWIAFAIPNVIGAAAMGWVLRDAEASRRFVERHAGACSLFSIVTIAYHIFFACWMIQRLRGWAWIALTAAAVASLVPARNLTRWGLAIFALIASTVMWVMLNNQESALMLPSWRSTTTDLSPASAGLLLFAFVIGFGLCPYLDLTFHRARQSTSPAGGRIAFGVGFGIVFFAMIVFTLLYARRIMPAVAGYDVSPVSTMFICIHLIAQSAFTVAAHARELGREQGFKGRSALAAVFILAAMGLGLWVSTPRQFYGRDAGEMIYWCLLGFYGTVFPACVLVGRNVKNKALAVGFISLVAFPFYWVGFVERRPIWLIAGAAIVLASWMMGRSTRTPLLSEAKMRIP